MKFIIYTFLFLVSFSGIAQERVAFSSEFFINGNDTLKYSILMPENFSKEIQYPLVLFLHGAGERGNNNTSQLVHGSKLFLNEANRAQFPAIVIFPQCPKNDYWSNAEVDRSTKPISLNFPLNKPPTTSLNLVINLMDEFVAKDFVNKNQVYIGGLSMGGMGTFEMLSRRPDLFAAAIVICGAGNIKTAATFATKTKLWVFHGAKDDVVNPQESIDMIAAILSSGGSPNFTLYANANHNSWDSTFAEPQLLPWLFSISKE